MARWRYAVTTRRSSSSSSASSCSSAWNIGISSVSITPSGRQEVLTELMPMFQALEQMDAELDDDERRVVTAYLQRAAAALRAVL